MATQTPRCICGPTCENRGHCLIPQHHREGCPVAGPAISGFDAGEDSQWADHRELLRERPTFAEAQFQNAYQLSNADMHTLKTARLRDTHPIACNCSECTGKPEADAYAEGYRAGRKAALREVGCECGAVKGHRSDGKRICGCSISTIKCNRCRLLDEAESGEQERA